MPFITEKEINTIRGKVLAGHASRDEILSVFSHLDELESQLDFMDAQDTFGTEGWRRYLDLPG